MLREILRIQDRDEISLTRFSAGTEGIVVRIRGDVWKSRGRDMFRLIILSENLQPRAGMQSRSNPPPWKMSANVPMQIGPPSADPRAGLR
jgi:hypothetical protein